ncbi:DUF418 domain-containing protein [Paenibacillus caseinilyticus]|uniref:DUF418 domain-containing protein n=1 Tax=Paenibacillus mucilaginosus K02 TaxID=997761 RepID=I0BL25_9BACL|nr:DUF418 domain-containing protein [Paenibacillus mucilaginosus]AFH63072.1 hypothetical protein B2K_20595 [Paenibacillus mucilaginosus K02]
MNTLQTGSSRIESLDVIRGFAVLGIFFVNVPEMIGSGISFQPSYSGSDAAVRLLYDMFFQTKFYSIFAFLFGLSFYFFMQRAEQQGKPARRLFSRRLGILLLIGLLHAVLLWYGDILYTYALLGFLLLLFYRRSSKTVLVWGVVLTGLYAAVVSLLILLMNGLGMSAELSSPEFAGVPGWKERAVYLLGDGLPNVLFIGIEVLGLFLLGLHAGKKGWLEGDAEAGAKPLRVAQWTALLLSGLLFIPMLRYYFSHESYTPMEIFHLTHLSGKTMAVFYICTLLRLIRRYGAHRLEDFAAIGRTALSNYLAQSLLTWAALLALGDAAADLPLWAGAVYCIVVSLLLTFGSRLWLLRFRMGPAEWLWRAGTYGTLPPLARTLKAPSTHSGGLGH